MTIRRLKGRMIRNRPKDPDVLDLLRLYSETSKPPFLFGGKRAIFSEVSIRRHTHVNNAITVKVELLTLKRIAR